MAMAFILPSNKYPLMFVPVRSKSGKANAETEQLLRMQFKVEFSKVNALQPLFRLSFLQLLTPSTPSDPVAFPSCLQLLWALDKGPCQTPMPIYGIKSYQKF